MNNNKGTYIYDGDVNDVFLNASFILYDAVVHTLGANGLNTAIPTSNNYLSIINDGKTILESISSNDSAIRLALNTLKESSFATNIHAGDGTTSTVVLQHKLLSDVLKYNSKHADKLIDSNYIKECRDIILSNLPTFMNTIKSDDDLLKVIEVSLGSSDLSGLVLESFKGLNSWQKPSLIKVRDAKETKVLSIDGISLNPVEINPVVLKETQQEYNLPIKVMIITQQISRIDSQFARILQRLSLSQEPVVILYTEIMPSVLDQILFNIQEGSLNVIPIRLAMPVNKLDEYIAELSRYFNVTPITDLNPYQVCFNNEDILGKGSGYILNKDSVILKSDNPDYYSELLPSKSSLIQVGFITFSQQEETYRRLEDAINSSYNAITSGYTIGAGYTYMCLSTYLPDDSRKIIIQGALSHIFELLSMNKNTDEFINFCMNNVYDSYKVTEQVILNSFTVVSQVLSTKRLLVPLSRTDGLYVNKEKTPQIG